MSEKASLIYDHDIQTFRKRFHDWGEPTYRADQLWDGLYKKLWNNVEQFTNIPKTLRKKIADAYEFSNLTYGTHVISQDGETQKTLFYLPDGNPIEAVLMRYKRRRTLCISTQAGCAMGCVFCATGQMGFLRNMTSGEIIEQVLFYARQLATSGERVTNIVVMGMGEPFHNYAATMAAMDRLGDAKGFNFGARRMTISTVGLIPNIKQFTRENRQINLAISLHAIDDELRSSMLPINRKYPIKELLLACNEYVQHTHRRISFEWALIRNVNDSTEHAMVLGTKLQIFRHQGATLCHVNVIPLNPTMGYQGEPTTHERAQHFKSTLEGMGIPCTIRIRRGIEIQAGCGQLASVARE